jgi:hypothetical protein
MKQEVTIQLGLSGKDFAAALGHEDTRTTKQPMGVNFYDLDWPPKLPGKVNVNHSSNGFQIDAVLGVMGTEDLKLPGGVQQININFGVTADSLIPHDEARLRVMALLKRLQDAGWRQHYFFSQARIKGRSSLRNHGDLDARYVPTFEEWMALGTTSAGSWQLEANGVYMDITMHRDSGRMNPHQPGAYFMAMTIQTEESQLRLSVPEEDRDNWKPLWPARYKQFQQWRIEKEAAARAKGLEIDTQYQDPPILALRVASLSSRVGQPCPKDGIWEARLPANHREAAHLASVPNRFKQVKAGQAMPELYASFMSKTADADNAALVWTWVRPA